MYQFNIEDFKAAIKAHKGLQKSNKYVMQFFPPIGLQNSTNVFRDLEMFADQIILPGVSLETGQVRRYGYGPTEKRPIGHTFNDLQVSIILTGEGDTYTVFKDWISLIMPFNMSSGIGSNIEGKPYLITYKNEYITDLRIQLLNENSNQENIPISLIVREAFPIGISDLPLAWGDLNNVARITIHFCYTDWFLEANPERISQLILK